MPKIVEKDGYKFFSYRNQHRPVRVHVRMVKARPFSMLSRSFTPELPAPTEQTKVIGRVNRCRGYLVEGQAAADNVRESDDTDVRMAGEVIGCLMQETDKFLIGFAVAEVFPPMRHQDR